MSDLKPTKANQEEAAVWAKLSRSRAWKKVCDYLKIEIDEANKIINTIGFDRSKMFSERDIALTKKQTLEYLINLPSDMAAQLSGTVIAGGEPEGLDPYDENNEIDEEIYEAKDF